jgi:hypothetical protein
MHACLRQRIRVRGRAQEVCLNGGSESVGQSAPGDLEYAGEDGWGSGGILRTNLNTSSRWQPLRDGLETIGHGASVDIQSQMGQIER